jgi:hypothetical protein
MGTKRSRLRTVISLLALGFMAVLLSSSDVPAEPQSYLMTCHGGGDMWGLWDASGTGASIVFQKAPVGASQRPPGPGECAWIDRPIRRDEPGTLLFNRWQMAPFSKILLTPSGIRVLDWNSRSAAVGPLQAVQSGRVFYVHAYNNGRQFTVTRVGP